MIFDENSIDKLRESVRSRISAKRYQHTLGVEEMARCLGSVLMPEKLSELRVAALLHDIAKEIDYNEQVDLVKSSDLLYTDEDLAAAPAVHSIAAVPVIIRDFPEYATDDVLSAVANHTLGNVGMSVFDEIIYISDYTEAGRTYPACKAVRAYLLDNISAKNSYTDNVKYLHKGILTSIESTVNSLEQRREWIHSRTYLTKTYLENLIHE